MNDQTLVRMASQIADFHAPYTEAERIEGIATHLRKFWDPRMRERLIALSEAPDPPLPAVILAAIERLKTLS